MSTVDTPTRSALPRRDPGTGGNAPLPSFLRAYGHEVRNYVGTMRNGLYLLRLQVEPSAAPLLELMERQLAAMLDTYRLMADAERLLVDAPADRRFRADLADLAGAVAGRVVTARRGISVRAVAPGTVPVSAEPERVALAVEIFVAEALACAVENSDVLLVARAHATGGCIDIRYSGTSPDPGMAAENDSAPTSAHALLMAVAEALVQGQHGVVRHDRDGASGTSVYTLTLPGATHADPSA